MRILVVDDEQILTHLYQLRLGRAGHEVLAFNHPEEALAAMSDDIDAVISDIDMPGMNGVEMSRLLRSDFDVPICFCTGSDPADETVRQAREIGPVFNKDGRFEALLATLERLHEQQRGSVVERDAYLELTTTEVEAARVIELRPNGVSVSANRYLPPATEITLTITLNGEELFLSSKVRRCVSSNSAFALTLVFDEVPASWLAHKLENRDLSVA